MTRGCDRRTGRTEAEARGKGAISNVMRSTWSAAKEVDREGKVEAGHGLCGRRCEVLDPPLHEREYQHAGPTKSPAKRLVVSADMDVSCLVGDEIVPGIALLPIFRLRNYFLLCNRFLITLLLLTLYISSFLYLISLLFLIS
jgi:hypothetical protein